MLTRRNAPLSLLSVAGSPRHPQKPSFTRKNIHLMWLARFSGAIVRRRGQALLMESANVR
jgi:hypothetical protein